MQDHTDTAMDERLTDAARHRPDLPAGLMQRVLADAARVQLDHRPQSNVVALRPPKPRPFLGWATAGALAASALFGLSLGYGATDSLVDVPGISDILSSLNLTTTTGTTSDELSALASFLAES